MENTQLPQDIVAFEQELKALLDKYHIRIDTTIEFSHYKIIPVDAQLAMIVLRNHGAVFAPHYVREEENK